MKKLQELTLFDKFLFDETMDIPEAHEAVLQIIFGDDNLKRFNEGDTVYFIASSIFVRKAKVVRNAGGFCTIIFDGNGNCGTSGTRVRESKLYRTQEEANAIVKQHKEANKRR